MLTNDVVDTGVPPPAAWRETLQQLAQARLAADAAVFHVAIRTWVAGLREHFTAETIWAELRRRVTAEAAVGHTLVMMLDVPTDPLTHVTPWVWSAVPPIVVDGQPPSNPLQWVAQLRMHSPEFQAWEAELHGLLQCAHDMEWVAGRDGGLRLRITVDLSPFV